ncbi:hypothetical protein EJD97_011835 [Solanum chilense]|uniref:CCHC-type domain-containing protein n=1 Tax=Solanum chilense TaxID=4083 RepID=A0A6N2BHD6_SOLCI|nr:hypothetical protein EJD97_011835 [Solanum chilense]
MTQDQVVTSHAQAMMTQYNQGVGPQVNPYASTPASRIRDFMRMNPPTFHRTKVDEDPEGFINEVLKVVDATVVTSKEKAEIDAYQLNDMNRDGKRPRLDELSETKSKKGFYNKDSPMVSKDSVPNQNYQGGNGSGSTFERFRYTTCWKNHLDKCLNSTDGCFGCGNRGHKMRDCPILKVKGKDTNQAPQDGLHPNTQTRTFLYVTS